MQTSAARTVLRNIASNWTGFFVQGAIVFFLTPVVLHALGDARYGVWLLVISITGYCGLLDAGLRGAITQFTTRHLATRNYERLNSTLSTAVAAMAVVGLAVLAATSFLAFAAPLLFKIPEAVKGEVLWCILIVGGSTAIQLMMFPHAAVLTAAQRFDLINAVSIATRMASGLMIWIALSRGYGLVALSLITAGAELCGYAVRCLLAYVVVPELEFRIRNASWATFREMYSYSLWTFLITIGQSIFSYASPLVIGAFMPVAAVGRYALAVAACTHLESLIRPVDQVFFPLLTQLHATGQHAALRKVYVAGSRMSFVIASSLAVGAGLWADDFFRFWIGAKYVAQGGEFTPVPLLVQLLLIGLLGRMMSCFGGQVLLASLRVRTIGVLSFCDAMSSLALALILVPRHGLIGMVIASVVPIFVFRVAAAQIIVGTLMRVSIAEFLWQVIGRSTLAGGAIACDVRLVQHFLPAQSLKEVVGYGLLSACFAAPITIFVGLNSDERIRFVVNPFMKLMTRLSGAAALPTTPDVTGATQHAEERN